MAVGEKYRVPSSVSLEQFRNARPFIVKDEAVTVNALEFGEQRTRTDPAAPKVAMLVGLVTTYPLPVGAVYTPGRRMMVGLENESERCRASSIDAHGEVSVAPQLGLIEPVIFAYIVDAIDACARAATSTRRALLTGANVAYDKRGAKSGKEGFHPFARKHATVDCDAHGPQHARKQAYWVC